MVAIALPLEPGRQALAGLAGRSVVDCSGAVKRDGTGVYGLGADPQRGRWYGNPGCIAGAVITGLRDAEVRVGGPVHITAVGGASYAPRGQSGTMRVARRQLDHPHVAEIAATGLEIASFTPVICYGTDRGLVVSISGIGSLVPQGDAFDVADIVGLDGLILRARQDGDHFALTVGIDNLTWPASRALELAYSLI